MAMVLGPARQVGRLTGRLLGGPWRHGIDFSLGIFDSAVPTPVSYIKRKKISKNINAYIIFEIVPTGIPPRSRTRLRSEVVSTAW